MKSLTGSILCLLFLIAAISIASSLINNWKLKKVEISFDAISHPKETNFIRRTSDVGLLVGNSDHCDYFVGELRSFTGSRENINDFYKKLPIWSPIDNSQQQEALNIIFLEQGKIPRQEIEYLPHYYRTENQWHITPEVKLQKLYIVYFLDVGVANEGWDIRCR